MKGLLGTVLCTLALAAVGTAASADDYPSRQIRIIVPFAAGGSADIVARLVGHRLQTDLGQPVLVENRAGAGGNLGFDAAARSPADGYTLLLTSNSMTINATLYTKLTFDPINSFAPITLATTEPNILVVNNDVPAKTLKELIALAKAKPGALTFASGGNGTTSHLSAELMKMMGGLDIRHVPYKGPGAAFVDTSTGVTSMFFSGQGFGAADIKAGKVRALGTTTATRTPMFPDVPTIAEAGLPGFEMTVWTGFVAPAGTPHEIIGKLNGAIVAALRAPEVKGKLDTLGFQIVGDRPEAFGAFIRSEIEKWGKVVRATGSRAD